MSSPAERLFQQQLAATTGEAGAVDLAQLSELVIGVYAEADLDRRHAEQAAELMAADRDALGLRLESSADALQALSLRLGLALDTMTNGLALFGRDGRLVVCNRRQLDILGLAEAQVQPGCSFEQFLRASPQLSEALVQQRLHLAAVANDGELQQTLVGKREVRVMLRRVADGGFLMSCEDVTERNRDASRLAFLAHHDLLTELPNRALLRQRLEQRLQQGPCAVLCLDLDGFKMVNDTLGHAVGDSLLRAVGARLRHQVRGEETLGRLAGDEFAAVIGGNKEHAIGVAARMIDAISARFGIDGHVVNTSASIGIALAPEDGETPEALLIHADMALHQAKADGRCCVRLFKPAMGAVMHARRSLEQDLRVALAEGQFELHYQSQVRVSDGSITGFEALLRWFHPERGWIVPDSFIPVAEESGLILGIGEWVLRTACHEALRWPETIAVAVNVSTMQLRGGGLYQAVAETLRSTGLAADRLELEVTETALLNDNAAALEVMQRLRSLGVRIAMDDFGTGYSSLNYLQSFPFDRIKIDRSFISRLGHDAKALAIVRAVTGLGRSLGIPVIAEGVETVEQQNLLAVENCSLAQGFLYNRPMPPARVLRLLGQVIEALGVA